jgi:hypothetical protein
MEEIREKDEASYLVQMAPDFISLSSQNHLNKFESYFHQNLLFG